MPPQRVRRVCSPLPSSNRVWRIDDVRPQKQAQEDDEHDRWEDRDGDDVDHDGADARLPRLAKNLVRFALSQELQRAVMKRAEMTNKGSSLPLSLSARVPAAANRAHSDQGRPLQ